MLILLPPSEGKTTPLSGAPLDFAALSFPTLTPVRRRVLAELVTMCRTDPATAVKALGLGPKQLEDVDRNRRLAKAAAAPAIKVYSGVLFDALDYASLPARATSRADRDVLISSALWGLLRPRDAIPAYRLSASVSLPSIGSLRTTWRPHVSALLTEVDDFIIDLRSSTYRQMAPPPSHATNWVGIRVLQERAGRRVTVSHFNKATKGRIARALLKSRREPTSIASLTSALESFGFHSEPSADHPSTIDVIVTDV
jgi:cytoplasmic iron level regulating protein YaaA (DUF328/UPF0246 family)